MIPIIKNLLNIWVMEFSKQFGALVLTGTGTLAFQAKCAGSSPACSTNILVISA